MHATRTHKPLSIFQLAMINVIAVDSLRTLTVGVEYGFALLFFYAVVAIAFFIPTVLVSAELATAWPTTGGVYVWVREAFGLRWGFLVIWLQWVYNIVWYPTIFAFIAGTMSYLIDPALSSHKTYMALTVFILYWSATLMNACGIRVSSLFSTLAAIIGTMLPMMFIIGLGMAWILEGHPAKITFSTQAFFPNLDNFKNIAFITTIAFGLVGMEMSAVHAGDVQKPERDYPWALGISSVLILLSLTCASLAIAIVVPQSQLNLISGLLDAFRAFLSAHGWQGVMPWVVGMIVLGSLGNAAAWILGPARGLWVAAKECNLPSFMQKTNRQQMPIGILLLQGLIFTALCGLFLFMPTVSSSYWLLTDLTAQLALLLYILLFAAAIKLRYKKPNTVRAFKIPGDHIGMWSVSGMGIMFCIFAFILGFIPPENLPVGDLVVFEAVLIAGLVFFCAPAVWVHRRLK